MLVMVIRVVQAGQFHLKDNGSINITGEDASSQDNYLGFVLEEVARSGKVKYSKISVTVQ